MTKYKSVRGLWRVWNENLFVCHVSSWFCVMVVCLVKFFIVGPRLNYAVWKALCGITRAICYEQ